MNNVLRHIGDSILIDINPLISGKVHLTGYVDVINGLTQTRSVERQYRISVDNIFWSDWNKLTNANLSADTYTTENSLFIQVRYTRTGTDAEGDIEFVSIDFVGNTESIQFVAPTLSNSIFAKLIGTTELKQLELNLFKKLYFRGILPQYITRAENVDYKEDKDFVDFFYSVARFFALLIRFFKRFENFRNDEELLREQIRGYGIYFNESNVSLEELQYIAQNILSVIQQRGTEMVFNRKGDILPNGETAAIDGEVLRLVRSRECDEIVYDAVPKYKMGWCMKNASPMYKGTSRSYNLNKTKENTQDFQSLDNFILTKSGSGDYQLSNASEEKNVLKLTTLYTNGQAGLGGVYEDAAGLGLIVADPKMDYEITFAFKINSIDNTSLKFGVSGFDINKNYLNDAFITTNREAVHGEFFDLDLSQVRRDIWYHVRGVVHAYSTEFFESTTNIGRGSDLIFNNFFTKYFLPNIIIESEGSADVDIWDYKVRPLVRGKNIMPLRDDSVDAKSLGFINASPVFYTYFKNNNNGMSVDEITDIIEKYLYPFNSINLFTVISNF